MTETHLRYLSSGPNIVFTGGAGHHRPGHKLRRLLVLALASHKGDAAQRDLLDVLEGEVDGLHLTAALTYPRDREPLGSEAILSQPYTSRNFLETLFRASSSHNGSIEV